MRADKDLTKTRIKTETKKKSARKNGGQPAKALFFTVKHRGFGLRR